MTSTFMGLELGMSALFAQQTALNTTGQNIANANTDGYTRQRAEMQASPAIPYPGMNSGVGPGQLGTGVEVNQISRLRDDYLDVQYRQQNQDLGNYTAQADTYSKLEGLLNEPSSSGISNAMDQFFQGWQELSKTPDSAAARAVVVQNGVSLAETFQYTNDQLDQMSSDVNNVIQTDVSNVNSLTQQIGALNDQISRLVPNNYQPNDLYDKRDVLLDQLSKLVNIDVKPSNGGNGMVDVFVGNQAIVQGKTANNVTYQSGGNTNQISINGSPVTLQSGDLLGRIEDATKIIPDIKGKINTLENEFVSQVNNLQSKGNILNGTTSNLYFFVDQKDVNQNNVNQSYNVSNTPQTGIDMASTTDESQQVNWVVNPDILNNLNNIAAATSSNAGDGSNALAIANLQTTVLSFNGTSATAGDYYQNVIGQLGVDSQQAQNMQNNTQTLVNQVDNQRQSVSGVSLDEEMTNMIRFQQAYNAAARVVTTMDAVLDKVINGMGT